MSPDISTDPGFAFAGTDSFTGPGRPDAAGGPQQAHAAADVVADVAAQQADPLGALAALEGTWKGHGFNAIWRPHHPASPRTASSELNRTNETLVFSKINGAIPNRGLANPDIDMFGLTYLQQIAEASTGDGLHIEPGIWATVPHTTDPSVPPTVVRMASIPHGTVILGPGQRPGPPGWPAAHPEQQHLPDLLQPAPVYRPQRRCGLLSELELSIPTPFRFVAPGVTQDMVTNPNKVIQDALTASLTGHPR